MALRVAVLMGGVSPEHPVSLASGCGVLAELDPTLYQAFPVLISRDNEWLWPSSPESLPENWNPENWNVQAAEACLQNPPPGWSRAIFPRFENFPEADIFFIALHGVGGEDGRLQGFLEMAGQPFTGSDSLGSSLAMDKILSKQLYALSGVPTAAWVVLAPNEFTPGEIVRSADHIEREIGLPAG